MLAIVRNKKALTLQALLERVLRHVYENNLTNEEQREMQDSVVNWYNKIELDKSLQRVNEDEEYRLMWICKYLKDNEAGKLDARKALFKEYHIDWRKHHNLPGARTLADFIRGKRLAEESRRRHGF